MTEESVDLEELHAFCAHLAILAGSYLRDQALERRLGTGHDLDVQIKANAAVRTRTTASTRSLADR